jgi:hypothetical protein
LLAGYRTKIGCFFVWIVAVVIMPQFSNS